MRPTRLVAWMLAAVVTVAAIVWWYASNRIFSKCEDKIQKEVRSPSGDAVAILYQRNCGATTQISSIVSVHAAKGVGRDDDSRVLVLSKPCDVDLSWLDEGHIQLSYPLTCAVAERRDHWHSVVITHLITGG